MLGRYTTGPRQGADHSSHPRRPPSGGRRPTLVYSPPRRHRGYAARRAFHDEQRGRTRSGIPASVPRREAGRVTLTASPEARAASLRSWRALAARLQTVSPRSLARGLLMLAAVAVPVWIAAISWPALLPFAA